MFILSSFSHFVAQIEWVFGKQPPYRPTRAILTNTTVFYITISSSYHNKSITAVISTINKIPEHIITANISYTSPNICMVQPMRQSEFGNFLLYVFIRSVHLESNCSVISSFGIKNGEYTNTVQIINC